MQMSAAQGPRLTDAEFFGQCLDTSRPGLEGIPAAVAQGDYAAARRLFAAEVRSSLEPRRLFSIERSFHGGGHGLPGESVAEAAERILTLHLVSTGFPHQFRDEVDWFANPTPNEYREWTWQLSRHPEWAVLGQRYLETGDERFAEGFVRLFRSWVRQVAVEPLDAVSHETRAWRTIECGIRMGGSWPWALHSFIRSPHLTDDVLVDWFKTVWEHGWRLRHVHHTHNWLIMEQNGLAQIGILYPQFAAAGEWLRFAFEVLVREVETQVYPGGMQYELSTGYHQVNIHNYEWLWDVARAYDVPVPDAFRAVLERMHEANIKLMMPDGRLPDVNDGGWVDVPALLRQSQRHYPERRDFRWAASRGAEGRAPAYTSVAMPNAGLFALRSGWEDDAVYGFFDGGPFGHAHQHEDKLSLLVHAHGRLLLTEAGNYAYDTSQMRRYVLSTRAHNTVRVDGQDQNRRGAYDNAVPPALDRPAGAHWRSAPDCDVVEAEYDEGYGKGAALRVVHRRKVLFLKTGIADTLGPCFLVVDRLLPDDDDSHEIQVLWHLNTGMPAVERDSASGGVAAYSTDAGLANLLVAPAAVSDLQVEVVSGQTEPEWQGWHAAGKAEPIPTVVCRWSLSGAGRLVTLLWPLRPGAEPSAVHVEAGEAVGNTDIRLQLSDGECLELDEGDYSF